MKVYKFRALSNLERIADILINDRFYAAKYTDLNDPMEGFFYYQEDIDPAFVDKIKEDRGKTRICSFSKSFSSPLLWAHYADQFKGLCFEVELDESLCSFIQEVIYDNSFLLLSKDDQSFEGFFQNVVFSKKHLAWALEEEVRVLSEDEYIIHPCVQVTAILYGRRTPNVVKQFVEKTKGKSVLLRETDINKATGMVEAK